MAGLDAAQKAELAQRLAAALARPDAYERINAAHALGLLDESARAVRDSLRPLLRDPEDLVRREARAALARLGVERATAVAAEAAEYRRLRGAEAAEARHDRREALRRLGYILSSRGERPPEGIGALADGLEDGHQPVRAVAVTTLHQIASVGCEDVRPATGALIGAVARADRNTAYVAFATLEVMSLTKGDGLPTTRGAFARLGDAEREGVARRIAALVAEARLPAGCPEPPRTRTLPPAAPEP
jgi:hypothetical protein